MSCCDETTARVPATDVSRRSLFKGAALVASVIPAARPTRSEQPDSRQFEVVHQPRTQPQRARADAESGLEYRERFNAVVLGVRYRNDLHRWL